MKSYYSNGVVPSYLRKIPQSDWISLTPLHVPTEEHDKILDENNWIETIGFEISVSIGTNDCTYNYNYEFWDLI